MSTLVVGEQPWITEVIERRRALGQDLYDEVWEGVYHVAPNAGTEHGQVGFQVLMALASQADRLGLVGTQPFNLGTGKTDFRVPDGGWFDRAQAGVYAATARVVLEVLSPGDETYEKFAFYLERGVAEILVAHPTERWIRCYVKTGPEFNERPGSQVFDMTMAQLVALIHWP